MNAFYTQALLKKVAKNVLQNIYYFNLFLTLTGRLSRYRDVRKLNSAIREDECHNIVT